MNKDDRIDCLFIRHRILELLQVYKENLDKEAVDAVRGYIGVGENEMAYEGLFIELMGLQFCPTDIDIDMYMKIGKVLGLDKESVFHPGFWEWFTEYVNKHNK